MYIQQIIPIVNVVKAKKNKKYHCMTDIQCVIKNIKLYYIYDNISNCHSFAMFYMTWNFE